MEKGHAPRWAALFNLKARAYPFLSRARAYPNNLLTLQNNVQHPSYLNYKNNVQYLFIYIIFGPRQGVSPYVIGELQHSLISTPAVASKQIRYAKSYPIFTGFYFSTRRGIRYFESILATPDAAQLSGLIRASKPEASIQAHISLMSSFVLPRRPMSA